MIKLTAKNQEFKEMLAAMRHIADEVRVNITPEGLTSAMVNPANTSMLYLNLPGQIFNGYNVDESRTIGIDIREWYGAIQFNNAKDLIEFELEITKQFSGAQGTGKPYESIYGIFKDLDGFEDAIAILDPAALRKEPKPIELPKDAMVKISTDRLKKILKKAAMKQKRSSRRSHYSADYYIKFIVENGTFITTHEADIRKGKSKTIATRETEITGKAHAVYSTFELLELISAIKDKTVTLEFGDDYPLIIHFKILQHGTGRYLLAPMVEEEPRRRRDPPQTVPQDPAQTSGQEVPPATPQDPAKDPAQTITPAAQGTTEGTA